MRKIKKTAVKWAILYLIITVGSWMFLYSYANSYNKLTDNKIVPAALHTNERGFELEIIGQSFKTSLEAFEPESKLYFAAYIFMPEEMRILGTVKKQLAHLRLSRLPCAALHSLEIHQYSCGCAPCTEHTILRLNAQLIS